MFNQASPQVLASRLKLDWYFHRQYHAPEEGSQSFNLNRGFHLKLSRVMSQGEGLLVPDKTGSIIVLENYF